MKFENSYYLIGDGKNLSLINDEGIQTFANAELVSFSANFQADRIYPSLDDDFVVGIGASTVTLDCSFKCKNWSRSLDNVGAKELLSQNLLESLSVAELFKLINKKLDKR